LDDLLEKVDSILEQDMVPLDVVIPFSRGDLVQMIHQQGTVDLEEYSQKGTHIVGRAPERLVGLIESTQG
jgi:GTP-binding protein HflX